MPLLLLDSKFLNLTLLLNIIKYLIYAKICSGHKYDKLKMCTLSYNIEEIVFGFLTLYEFLFTIFTPTPPSVNRL